ncbi:MAG: signal peptidase I [Chloroflexi bacterium]|nr:signal peptidase I [Chloroflexota bacterium]MDA1269662.1 signal peptidase I [Chloroflexota bacterium]
MGFVRYGIVNALIVAMLVVVWVVVAPRALGGLTTYAVVNGTSMNPLLHRGDVVVLRGADRVGVGDVVSYFSQSLGTLVVHRIVSEEQGVFTFQGDNNDWIDSDQLDAEAVLGKMWFKIPNAGRVFMWFGEPWRIAVITGGLVFMFGFSSGPGKKQPKVEDSLLHRRPFKSFVETTMSAVLGPTGQIVLGISIVFAVIAGLISIYAWKSSTTEIQPVSVHFTHSGHFEISAPPPLPQVSTVPLGNGDPIFVDLTPEIVSTLSYNFKTDGVVERLRGTAVIYGILSNLNGWHQTVRAMEPVPFEGNEVTISTSWYMPGIMDIVMRVEEATQSSMRYYTAAMVGEIRVSGTLDGQPFEDLFKPTPHFRINPPNEIYVETTATRILSGALTLPGHEDHDEFNLDQHGTVETSVVGERSISFRALQLSISSLRWIASVLFVLSIAFLAAIWWLTRRAEEQGEDFCIAARFGARIVVASNDDSAQRPVRVLARFEDLLHMSDIFGRLIVQGQGSGGSEYTVDGDGVRYIYDSRRPAPDS